MANFLIQTIRGQVKHDFCFGAIEAIEYQNWYNRGSHDYSLADEVSSNDYSGYIPIGSIQFVRSFLETYHGVSEMLPIGLPYVFSQERFAKRGIQYISKDEQLSLISDTPVFVKSLSSLKGFTEIITKKDLHRVPNADLLVSEVVEIDSEWRAFVFRGELVGLQNYLGDFTMFPDVVFIQECIKTYTNCPPAYTLDVGVNSVKGTFVIEVHNFYSCGLYGFADHKILPQMFYSSFQHLVKHKW